MTIMVKTNMGVQKPPADVMVMPLIDIEEPMRPPSRPRKLPPTPSRRAASTLRTMVLIAIVVLLITLASFLVGAILFTDVSRKHNAQRNVLFRCGVTSTQDTDYVVLKEAPPTASWFGVGPMSEMKVYSSASDLISAQLLNNLLEDMAIEDDVENIYVHDGPRSFRVVHDFNENYTNIISAERCFLMDMIRQFVLEPSSLLASFRNESGLELSHAHTVFTASLPGWLGGPGGLGGLPAAARPCLADNKPVYRLNLEGTHVLHKRSVEVRTTSPPGVDEDSTSTSASTSESNGQAGLVGQAGQARGEFVQFSGRHVQRITVRNLDAVLQFEKDNRLPQQ